MKKFVSTAALAALAALTGCTGMVNTYEDRQNIASQVVDSDFRQFADDWDTFWLIDQPSRLTEWQTR